MENLIKEVSDYEKEIIAEYIKRYSFKNYKGEKTCEFAGVDKILAPWNEAKQTLYKLFGNKLIINKSFELPETKALIRHEMKDFVFSSSLYKSFNEICMNSFSTELLCIWIAIFNIDNLISGYLYHSGESRKFTIEAHTIKKDTDDIKLYPNEDIVICQNEKIMKVIKKISDGFDIPNFEEFRIGHSKILNKKNYKDTITLSIHPLDYMTMSDNDCKWATCMSWEEEGEYRQGTVEMMNSPYVIVAYLDSNQAWDIFGDNKYFWSNKKWRCLFLVDEKLVTSIKSYPFSFGPLEKYIVNYLADLGKEKLGFTYSENVHTIEDDSLNLFIENGQEISLDFDTDNMYNDFGCTVSYIRLNPSKFKPEKTYTFNYSGNSECMWCGGSIYCDYDEEDKLVCDKCFEQITCTCCGYRFHTCDSINFDYYGDCYCNYCFSIHCKEESLTGNYYNKYDLETIYMIPSDELLKIKFNEKIPNFKLKDILVKNCKFFTINKHRLSDEKSFINTNFSNYFSFGNIHKIVCGYCEYYVAIATENFYTEEEKENFNKIIKELIER